MGIRIAPKGHSTRTTTANVALLAGSQALGILTAPQPKRATFDEIFTNLVTATDPYSFHAGTNKIVPPLIWYGDFDTRKVRNGDLIENIIESGLIDGFAGYLAGGGHFGGPVPDPPSALLGAIEGSVSGVILAGMSSLRTFSWTYYAGWVFDLGWGVIDAVTEIYKDEKLLYTGADNAGAAIVVNQPKIWGGDHVNGGEYYVADIMAGNLWPVQQPNPYMKAFLGHVPAWSGKARLVVRGPSGAEGSGLFGAGVQGGVTPRPIACTVLRLPNLLGVPAYKVINSKDANVVEVMADWMTGRNRGFGYGGRASLADFDLTNWQAAAQTIHDEGLGYSAEFKENISGKDVLEEMAAFCSAAVFEVPSTGEIKINLIRRDYSIPSLKVFDETNIVSVQNFSQETYQSTPNEIRLAFTDRDQNNKPRTLAAQNDAAIRAADDAIIPRSVSFRGVACQQTAKIILSRELMASFPRPPVTLEVKGRSGDDVEYGEVINWSYPKYRIARRILRVIGIEKSNTESNTVELTCAEDVFGSGDAINVVIGETIWTPPVFTFNELILKLPQIVLAFTGSVGAATGEMDIELPEIALALSGGVETLTTLDIDLPKLALALSGGIETLSDLEINLPEIVLALSGQVSGDAGIITEDGDTIETEDGDIITQDG